MSETHLYLWQENSQECQNVAKELGYLLGRIEKGKVTRDTANAYYMGKELFDTFPDEKDIRNSVNGYYLKADVAGGTGSGRTKNRVVVLVDSSARPVLNKGWFWRHDDRILWLVPRFFEEAEQYKDYV